jgi:hypothetical protein
MQSLGPEFQLLNLNLNTRPETCHAYVEFFLQSYTEKSIRGNCLANLHKMLGG